MGKKKSRFPTQRNRKYLVECRLQCVLDTDRVGFCDVNVGVALSLLVSMAANSGLFNLSVYRRS